MNIYNSEDNLIKRIDSISDDMARFISKEGCNQFPTVLFLADRMFISDEINLIKDLNLDVKLKKGDNYYWYKSSSFYENLRDVIKYILPNTKLFVPKTSPIGDIKRIFNIDGMKNYFLTTNNKLYYGSIDNCYEIPFGFGDFGDILNIFTIKENTDCILTKHNVYFIDTLNKTVSKKYSNDSVTFKDICYSGDYVVLATSKRGKVLKGLSTGNLSHDYDLEYYYNTTSTTNPDGSTTNDTYTNGMPYDEDVDRCFISGNYIYIGDSTTVAQFRLGESSDYGVEAGISIGLHRCKGNSEIIGKSAISTGNATGNATGNVSVGLTYTFKGKSITPISTTYTDLLVENDAVFAIYGSTIDCYNNGSSSPLFTLNTSNGFDSIKDLAFDVDESIIVLSNSNKLYETIKINDAVYPIKFLPIKFVFDNDKDTKVLNCENKTLSVREMMLCSVSSAKYDSVLGKSNGQKATFMCIYVKKPNAQTFIYFGNDRRQEKAIAVKKCCEVFDIG